MTPPARTPRQRKHDALNRLDRDIDAWVATAPGPDPAVPRRIHARARLIRTARCAVVLGPGLLCMGAVRGKLWQ